MESESDEPTSDMHAILEVMGLELAVYGIESASNPSSSHQIMEQTINIDWN